MINCFYLVIICLSIVGACFLLNDLSKHTCVEKYADITKATALVPAVPIPPLAPTKTVLSEQEMQNLLKEKAKQQKLRDDVKSALYYNPLMHVEKKDLPSLGAWSHGLLSPPNETESADVCPPGWIYDFDCNKCTYGEDLMDDGKFIYL